MKIHIVGEAHFTLNSFQNYTYLYKMNYCVIYVK